jgi:Alkylmercury lyase
VIRLDEHGRVRAAYSFSGVPTPHTVAIDGGPTVYAMCAIDALGIADMLGRDITIASTDPASGQEINVTVHSGRASWTPGTAVVFVGSDHRRDRSAVTAARQTPISRVPSRRRTAAAGS